MSIVATLRGACLKLLRRYPDSSDIVADIMEQTAALESSNSEPAVTKQYKVLRKAVRKVKSAKRIVRPAMQRVQPASKTPRYLRSERKRRMYEGEDCLFEKHGGSTKSLLRKSDFEAICRAISEGSTRTPQIVEKTQIRDNYVHTACRLLRAADLMNRDQYGFYPRPGVEAWFDKAMQAWDGVPSAEVSA